MIGGCPSVAVAEAGIRSDFGEIGDIDTGWDFGVVPFDFCDGGLSEGGEFCDSASGVGHIGMGHTDIAEELDGVSDLVAGLEVWCFHGCPLEGFVDLGEGNGVFLSGFEDNFDGAVLILAEDFSELESGLGRELDENPFAVLEVDHGCPLGDFGDLDFDDTLDGVFFGPTGELGIGLSGFFFDHFPEGLDFIGIEPDFSFGKSNGGVGGVRSDLVFAEAIEALEGLGEILFVEGDFLFQGVSGGVIHVDTGAEGCSDTLEGESVREGDFSAEFEDLEEGGVGVVEHGNSFCGENSLRAKCSEAVCGCP